MFKEYHFIQDKIWAPKPEDLQREVEWVAQRVREIGFDNLQRLARKARNVRENAYKEYSKYGVGAAILTSEKSVFSGCNVENVVYFAGHAEYVAITKAVSTGIQNRAGRTFIDAIAVVAGGDSGPCGFCRQMLLEFADNCVVLDVNPEGEIVQASSLKTLLPNAFGPSHLGIK
ncbi:MAG TPA: cytidine deaminase [Patescibacteria group bacterium]|nr:cytidine deaminase [Patescibacteria group bacterium]